MELTNREAKVLEILINHQTEYLSSDTIADLLGVSYKTIQTDIEALSNKLEDYNVAIESVRGRGYRIIFEGKDDLLLLNMLMQLRRQKRQNVDVSLFICKILSSAHYTTQQEMMDLLWFSQRELRECLKQVVSELAHHNLTIRSVPGSGFLIFGPELGKRLAFVYHLNVLQSNARMYEQFLENVDLKVDQIDYQIVLKLLNALAYDGYYVNENSENYLHYYLDYTLNRISDRSVVMQAEHALPYFDGLVLSNNEVLKGIFKNNLLEERYLRALLMFIVNESSIRDKMVKTKRELMLVDVVDRFFKRRPKLFRNTFVDIECLQQEITEALIMMMRRNSIGYREFNVNLNTMDQGDENVVALEFASLLLFKVESDLQVEFYHEDIVRLAMIFNVYFYKDMWSRFKRFILYSDHSVTQVRFLRRRLELAFPFIEVIESNYETIDTIDINEDSDLLIYEKESDRRNYSHELVFQSLSMAKEITQYLTTYVSDIQHKQSVFFALFSKDNFHPQMQFERRNEVVAWIFERYQTGKERMSVIQENVYTREMRYISTVYNRAAYPKIYVNKIKKPHMEVITLKEPMLWGGKEVDVIFVAMLPNSYTSLNVLGHPFSQIRQNANLVQRIKSSKSYDEMIKYVRKEVEKAF